MKTISLRPFKVPAPGTMTYGDLKNLIEFNQWPTIACYFNFAPKFTIQNRRPSFDYSSAPEEMKELLEKSKIKNPSIDIDPGEIEKELELSYQLSLTDEKYKKYHHLSRRKCRLLFYIKQKRICNYCLKDINFSNWTIDHKVPLSKNGPNTLANMIGACQSCNKLKGQKDLEEFLLEISKKISLDI